jgi:hypothetical protein
MKITPDISISGPVHPFSFAFVGSSKVPEPPVASSDISYFWDLREKWEIPTKALPLRLSH